MDYIQYLQIIKHSELNALPVRDSSQVVLFMASLVVSAVIPIGSLFISLSLSLLPRIALVAWLHIWCKTFTWLSHLRTCSVWPCSTSPSGHFVPLTIVRCRGCSHRGGNSGNRGHSQPAPQNIIPLASASLSSDHGKPFPHNSFQTTRFKFHSRLNKPIVSASITVILAEEEDRPSVSVHTSTSQSQDDSMLQGEDVGIVFDCGELRAEGSVPDVLKPPEDNTQDILASADPANPSDGNQRLAAPPGGNGTCAGDNTDDSWMGVPCRVEKDARDPLAKA